jgi:hypothetical protein
MTILHNPVRETESIARLASAAAAGLALVPLALCSFSGETGAQITADLVENATRLQSGAAVAAGAAALLVLAAVRLGRRAGSTVLTGAGIAVAVLFAAYYASFGAGGVVAGMMLENPGPGVGEGTALLVNMTELARYGVGLAVTGAAVAARATLPKGVWVAAAALAVLTVVPITSWLAALLIPLWLGACGTVRSDR